MRVFGLPILDQLRGAERILVMRPSWRIRVGVGMVVLVTL